MMNELMLDELMQLSPYDDSFPSKLLKEAFEYRVEESKLITQRIYNDIVESSIHPCIDTGSSEEKMRLVVDVTDDFLNEYKDGAVKLANEKGHMVAQLKVNGKYGSKLPIKEELYKDGPDSLDVQNAIQLQAIQDSLERISRQIQAIDENVKEVLVGQQNDRLGFYYSGVAIFLEAYNVKDEIFRSQLLSQSIKALTDSIFQLTLSLQSDINYLERKEYDKNKKYKYNLINEKISNIDKAFMAIHQASIMKAGIYCYQGEIKAMLSVLQEYERFIKGTIVGNAEMLQLCDPNENRTHNGVWKTRAKLHLDIGNMINILGSQENVLYLGNEGDEEYESV